LRTFPKNDNDVEVANLIMALEDEEQADAVFVDAGFGTGIVSIGQTLGRDWILVWFGGKSADPGCLNKRAEMYKKTRDWLKGGGAIPEDPTLHDELIAIELVERLDGKMQLKSKKDMKTDGVSSPNRADDLALTFAHPVLPKAGVFSRQRNSHADSEWDPLSELPRGRRDRAVVLE